MGPIGMLCIQRTLNKGRWPAFFTGLGAALSDLLYCLLTGLCLSFVTDFIEAHHISLQIAGSIIFILYGIYLYRSKPRPITEFAPSANTYWKDFVTGFLLTFSNPLIVFFILTLFARFNFLLPEFMGYHYAIGYIAIFLGAVLWWFFITFVVNKIRGRFNAKSLIGINRGLAVIMFFIAVYGIYTGLSEYFTLYR